MALRLHLCLWSIPAKLKGKQSNFCSQVAISLKLLLWLSIADLWECFRTHVPLEDGNKAHRELSRQGERISVLRSVGATTCGTRIYSFEHQPPSLAHFWCCKIPYTGEFINNKSLFGSKLWRPESLRVWWCFVWDLEPDHHGKVMSPRKIEESKEWLREPTLETDN